ncbi:MAG: D-alanyl-D-alanine carboxypeptidase [Candidatus Hydrogenedentes bacterium]|nr:D-alanyl-D-alanine carboxypeptidase [Candidatus Hydrogenedentota bacterium]
MKVLPMMYRIAVPVLVCCLLSLNVSHAARKAKKPAKVPTPAPAQIAPSYICVDAESGLVLAESNADEPRPAASMVKMLEFLLVSEGLEQGTWTLDAPLVISRNAEHMGGSQVYLKEGETWTLGRLMPAVAVASANDAAMAVAEGLWGSADAFLKLANQRVKQLGMNDSEFHSVHGLPPDKGEQPDRTTARDMATLARHCVQVPVILGWSSQQSLEFRPGEAIKENTNRLLGRVPGCDGLKTGFTRAAGWCVTATAKRGEIRVIVVVMGFDGDSDRFDLAQHLLEEGFSQIRRVCLITRGKAIEEPVPVANCETPAVRLEAADDLWINVKSEDVGRMKVSASLPKRLRAPVAVGTKVGAVHAQLDGQTLRSVPLVVPADLKAAGWRWKLEHAAMPARPPMQSSAR